MLYVTLYLANFWFQLQVAWIKFRHVRRPLDGAMFKCSYEGKIHNVKYLLILNKKLQTDCSVHMVKIINIRKICIHRKHSATERLSKFFVHIYTICITLTLENITFSILLTIFFNKSLVVHSSVRITQ